MRLLKTTLVALALLSPSWARGQSPPGNGVRHVEAPEEASEPQCQSTKDHICVEREDLKKFVQLARERKCLDTTQPEFTLDKITLITDEDGRVFYTGADPKRPYSLELKWCHLEATGHGEVHVIAAMNEPPTWGFRFRPKAYMGYLPVKALMDGREYGDGVDAGLMLDFFYWEWFNVNIAAGFRSAGGGFGFDITKNFGAYVGYAFTWDINPSPHSILAGAYFAF